MLLCLALWQISIAWNRRYLLQRLSRLATLATFGAFHAFAWLLPEDVHFSSLHFGLDLHVLNPHLLLNPPVKPVICASRQLSGCLCLLHFLQSLLDLLLLEPLLALDLPQVLLLLHLQVVLQPVQVVFLLLQLLLLQLLLLGEFLLLLFFLLLQDLLSVLHGLGEVIFG